MQLKLEENVPRRVDIFMEYIDKLVDKPVANWIIKKPSETITLRQIVLVPDAQPFSSVYPLRESSLLDMTNNTYPGKKIIDELYQTFNKSCYSEKFCYVFFFVCLLLFFFKF